MAGFSSGFSRGYSFSSGLQGSLTRMILWGHGFSRLGDFRGKTSGTAVFDTTDYPVHFVYRRRRRLKASKISK